LYAVGERPREIKAWAGRTRSKKRRRMRRGHFMVFLISAYFKLD
jgi:hypothetical protein